MIVTFLRSSSYGTHQLCEHKYFIEYVLGFRGKSNKKASIGNVTHKALEIIANAKLATQEGKDRFIEEDSGELLVKNVTPEKAIHLAFEHYRKVDDHHDWSEEDYRAARKYMYNTLNFHDGVFDPRLRTIVAVEKRFDITIEKPWALYDYSLPDGTKISGYLGIKGTIDLITKISDDTYEILDWKTGKFTKFPSDEEKKFDDVCNDFQFLLYHWAARQIYTDIPFVMLSVFYSQFLVPFTVPFSDADLVKTERLIRKKFDEIRGNRRPRLHKGWWCRYVCEANKPHEDTGKTKCEYFYNEARLKGVDQVLVDIGGQHKISEYGSGGGRHA